ncbi:MAG: rod shape-determining protein MreC [Pseudomonadota bacterium]
MNDFFLRGPSLQSRLIIVLVVSALAIVVEARVNQVKSLRAYLTSFVSPVQYLADMPGEVLNWSAHRFSSRQRMLEENDKLTTQLTLLNGELQRLDALKFENNNLRQLLAAPVKRDMYKIVAELMSLDNNPYSHQIVIDKGGMNSVYSGQAVIDSTGIIGQILEVGTTNSRVLLITDTSHAIPVRVGRTNFMSIAVGTGDYFELQLQHVPHSADVREGDLISSSGLGNVFPKGYPVGTVKTVISDESQPFKQVLVTPSANMGRLKFLLLLWTADKKPEGAISSTELKMLQRTLNEGE